MAPERKPLRKGVKYLRKSFSLIYRTAPFTYVKIGKILGSKLEEHIRDAKRRVPMRACSLECAIKRHEGVDLPLAPGHISYREECFSETP